MTTAVSRAKAVSPELFRSSYVTPQIPLILADLQDSWPARSKWCASYFRARFGQLLVPVRDYGAGSAGRPYLNLQLRFADYLDYWEALPVEGNGGQQNLYLAEWNFVEDCPELLEDFATPEHFLPDFMDQLPPEAQFGRVWLFIGQPGAHTPAHTDTFGTSAWLSMIQGTKAIRMVAPAHVAAIPRGTDLFAPRTEEMLHEAGIELLEAVISAGDTLFIPGRFLHQVNNVDKNIMVTKNFVDAPNVLGFLSDFESGVIAPIQALRAMRVRFLQEQLDAAGSSEVAAPACLPSSSFVREQLAWATRIDGDITRYRDQLAALERQRATG